MGNEEELHRVKEERNIQHTIKRRKTNLIGHILRRNYFLKHVTKGRKEGRIKVTRRRERRSKQYWMMLKKIGGVLGIETGRTRLPSVENSFWKGLWTCCKANCGMNERKSFGTSIVMLDNIKI